MMCRGAKGPAASKNAACPRAPPGPAAAAFSVSVVRDAGDTGQDLALQVFQRGAAAGGDVAHLVGATGFVDGGDAVAAADDGDAAVGFDFGDGFADAEGAVGEFGHFEAAHGSVPDDGLRFADGFGVEFGGFGADIEGHPSGGDVIADDLGIGFGVELIRGDVVDGEEEVDFEFLGFGDHFPGIVELVDFAEGIADVVALGFEEGVGHAAADDEGIDFGEQVADHGEFVGDFGAAEDGDEGADRFFDGAAEVGDFFFHQEPGDGGFEEFGDDGGRGVGAVGGAEGVIAIDVAVGGELLGELELLFFHRSLFRLILFFGHVVLFLDLALLFRVEAGVFEHEDVAGFHGGDFFVGVGAVGGEGDRFAEHFGEVFGDGLEAEIGFIAFFGRAAEVAHQDEAAAVVEDVFDRGEGAGDPGVVFDDPFFDRNVEVHAHDNALAFEIDVAKRFLIHDFLFLFGIGTFGNKKGGRPITTRPFSESQKPVITWR